MNANSGLSLFNVAWTAPPKKTFNLRITVYAHRAISPETIDEIDRVVTRAIGPEIDTRLIVIPVREVSSGPPPQ